MELLPESRQLASQRSRLKLFMEEKNVPEIVAEKIMKLPFIYERHGHLAECDKCKVILPILQTFTMSVWKPIRVFFEKCY